MPQTAHAWLQSEDRSGAETGLTAVTDDLIITSGDNLRLRTDLPLISMMYLISNSATYFPLFGKVTAPTIAGNPLRLTKGIGLNYLANGQIYDFRANPFGGIRAGDNVTGSGYETDEAGVAHYLGIVIIVSNAVIPQVVKAPLTHIHRCTATATGAGAWTQLGLTEVDALPAGLYEMYGARVEHASAIASRFVFKGMEARPAVIPVSLATDNVHPFSNFWGKGIEFVMPDGLPDIEILEATGSGTVEMELYLRKTR